MELSAVVMKYGLRMSRPESRLVSLLPGGASEHMEQRILNAAAARDALQQLPDRQTSERHGRMEKAAMLKERLKMLRQSLPFLSAAAVKSLKIEMKQIAAQLASLGEGSAGGSGSGMAATEKPVAETSASESKSEAPPETALPEQDAGSSRQKKNALSGTTAPEPDVKNNTATAANAEERQLREAIEELKGLYKTVREALKRKQQAGHDSARIPGAAYLRAYAIVPDKEGQVTFNV